MQLTFTKSAEFKIDVHSIRATLGDLKFVGRVVVETEGLCTVEFVPEGGS